MLRRSRLTLLAALLIAGVLGTAGCGQKGDLYLPDQDPHKKQPSSR